MKTNANTSLRPYRKTYEIKPFSEVRGWHQMPGYEKKVGGSLKVLRPYRVKSLGEFYKSQKYPHYVPEKPWLPTISLASPGARRVAPQTTKQSHRGTLGHYYIYQDTPEHKQVMHSLSTKSTSSKVGSHSYKPSYEFLYENESSVAGEGKSARHLSQVNFFGGNSDKEGRKENFDSKYKDDSGFVDFSRDNHREERKESFDSNNKNISGYIDYSKEKCKASEVNMRLSKGNIADKQEIFKQVTIEMPSGNVNLYKKNDLDSNVTQSGESIKTFWNGELQNEEAPSEIQHSTNSKPSNLENQPKSFKNLKFVIRKKPITDQPSPKSPASSSIPSKIQGTYLSIPERSDLQSDLISIDSSSDSENLNEVSIIEHEGQDQYLDIALETIESNLSPITEEFSRPEGETENSPIPEKIFSKKEKKITLKTKSNQLSESFSSKRDNTYPKIEKAPSEKSEPASKKLSEQKPLLTKKSFISRQGSKNEPQINIITANDPKHPLDFKSIPKHRKTNSMNMQNISADSPKSKKPTLKIAVHPPQGNKKAKRLKRTSTLTIDDNHLTATHKPQQKVKRMTTALEQSKTRNNLSPSSDSIYEIEAKGSVDKFISNYSLSILSQLHLLLFKLEENVVTLNKELADQASLEYFRNSKKRRSSKANFTRKRLKVELSIVLKPIRKRTQKDTEAKSGMNSLVENIKKSIFSDGMKKDLIGYVRRMRRSAHVTRVEKEMSQIINKRLKLNKSNQDFISSSSSNISDSLNISDSEESDNLANTHKKSHKSHHKDLNEIMLKLSAKNNRSRPVSFALHENQSVKLTTKSVENINFISESQNFEENNSNVNTELALMNWCSQPNMKKYLFSSPVNYKNYHIDVLQDFQETCNLNIEGGVDTDNLEAWMLKKRFYVMLDYWKSFASHEKSKNDYVLQEIPIEVEDLSEAKSNEILQIKKHLKRIKHDRMKNKDFIAKRVVKTFSGLTRPG